MYNICYLQVKFSVAHKTGNKLLVQNMYDEHNS